MLHATMILRYQFYNWWLHVPHVANYVYKTSLFHCLGHSALIGEQHNVYVCSKLLS